MPSEWAEYFERTEDMIDGILTTRYVYKDKDVEKLPDNLPMPPTNNFIDMFNGCYRLYDISALSKWDVSETVDMSYAFCDCALLQDLSPLSDWDVSNVECMHRMFGNCEWLHELTALTDWDCYSLKDASYMFSGCERLRDAPAVEEWELSTEVDQTNIFSYCPHLDSDDPYPSEWSDMDVDHCDDSDEDDEYTSHRSPSTLIMMSKWTISNA